MVYVLSHRKFHNVWQYRAFTSQADAEKFLSENKDMADYIILAVPMY